MEDFFGLNSPLLWKFQFKFNPPSSEFPMTLDGGGMDSFCNHTMALNSIHLFGAVFTGGKLAVVNFSFALSLTNVKARLLNLAFKDLKQSSQNLWKLLGNCLNFILIQGSWGSVDHQ